MNYPSLRYKKKVVLTILLMVTLVLVVVSSTRAQEDEDVSAQAIALFNSGQDSHEKGDLGAAIRDYEKAIKLLPDFPEAELQRGNAYQSIGKLDDAESAFRRALQLREDWSLAIANLGGVLVRKAKYAEAEKYLTKAIAMDEYNFPAYAAMTELMLRTKADSKTLGALLSRLTVMTGKANPAASIWASRGALEMALGDTKSARTSAARAVELDPKSLFALSTAAEVALRESDTASADTYVRKIEMIAPGAETTKALRARVLFADGKTVDALALLNSLPTPSAETLELRNQMLAVSTTNISELEKQLASDPKNALLLSKLCSGYRVSDPSRALDYCRRASEAAPQSVDPVIGYAAALVQARRYDEAVVVLRKLLTIAPDNSTVHANLGTALFQLKRYAEAKVEFRWLTTHQPDLAVAYYFLGIVHDQLMEFVDAEANYNQFLRIAHPESSKLEIEKVNLRLPIIRDLLREGKGKRRG